MSDETPPVEVVEKKAKKTRRTGRLTTNKINQITRLHIGGAGEREIARAAKLHLEQVQRVLRDFRPLFKDLKDAKVYDYQDVRRNLLSAAELSTLKLVVNPQKQEAASLRDCAFAFDRLYHAGRLEAGKSTSNIETKSFGEVVLVNGWSETPSKG